MDVEHGQAVAACLLDPVLVSVRQLALVTEQVLTQLEVLVLEEPLNLTLLLAHPIPKK